MNVSVDDCGERVTVKLSADGYVGRQLLRVGREMLAPCFNELEAIEKILEALEGPTITEKDNE